MLFIQQQFRLSNLSLPLKKYKTLCLPRTSSCSDLSKSHMGRSVSQLLHDPLDQASFRAVASQPLTCHHQPCSGDRQLKYVPSPQTDATISKFSSKDTHVYISVRYSSRCLPQRYIEVSFFLCFHPKQSLTCLLFSSIRVPNT